MPDSISAKRRRRHLEAMQDVVAMPGASLAVHVALVFIRPLTVLAIMRPRARTKLLFHGSLVVLALVASS
jgi:hypothetical protein